MTAQPDQHGGSPHRSPVAGGSVYLPLVQRPYVTAHRLRKSTLIALSWAIEDQFCARATAPVLFGGFQREQYWRPVRRRWETLAGIASYSMVFADFHAATPGDAPIRVPLPPESPLIQEWLLVCDAPDLPAVLVARELPGQGLVPENDRVFDAIWSIEPETVRVAARVCAQTALDLDIGQAKPLLYQLAENPPPSALGPAEASELFGRIIAYLDQFGNPSPELT